MQDKYGDKKTFTATIYKGQKITQLKRKYERQLFYSTYTIYINIMQMMVDKQWV